MSVTPTETLPDIRCQVENNFNLAFNSDNDVNQGELQSLNFVDFTCDDQLEEDESGSDSDDSNTNILPQVNCQGSVPQTFNVADLSLILSVDSTFELLLFQDEAPCFENNQFELNLEPGTLQGECFNCDIDSCKLRFPVDESVSVDLMKVLDVLLNCEETDSSDDTENNENNNNDAIINIIIPIVLLVSLLLFFLVFFFARRSQQQQEQILEANGTQHNPTLIAHPGTSSTTIPIRNIRKESFESFDAKRMSNLSQMSTNSAISYKSEISDDDIVKHNQVKEIISKDQSRFSAMSSLVTQQINRMSLTSVEKEHKGKDYNDKILNSCVDYLKSMIKKSTDNEFIKFNLRKAPQISLKFYISRLMQGLNDWYYEEESSPEVGIRCLLLSLIYMSQLTEKNPEFIITKLNIYKLTATFMLIAAKFTEDEVMSNHFWGDVCGFAVKDVNELEKLLCFEFGFDFVVDPEDLSKMFLFFNEEQYQDQ